MIKESDWKKFKKLKAAALEKFCAKVLADVQTAANRQNLSNHAKYLSVYKLIDNTVMVGKFTQHLDERC